MVTVHRAYRTSAGTLTAGQRIATMEYDGLGRRIVKAISNSADWDCTYHAYYDGQRMVELRNGSDQVLKQYVWGLTYIDELCQIGVNDDPGADDDAGTAGVQDLADAFYYACQDANFNVLALLSESGDLVERYEYTPYGQRTVFTSAGSNDPLAMSPLMESKRVEVSTVAQPYGLCDIGHQGLLHDKEFGLIYNRARMLHPVLGRFTQRDPAGYVDGLGLHEGYGGSPLGSTDPSGEIVIVSPGMWSSSETVAVFWKGDLKGLGSLVVNKINQEVLADGYESSASGALTAYQGNTGGHTVIPSYKSQIRDAYEKFKARKQKLKDGKKCSLEQFVVIGHSHSATAIYELIIEGFFSVAGRPRDEQASALVMIDSKLDWDSLRAKDKRLDSFVDKGVIKGTKTFVFNYYDSGSKFDSIWMSHEGKHYKGGIHIPSGHAKILQSDVLRAHLPGAVWTAYSLGIIFDQEDGRPKSMASSKADELWW